MESEWSRKQHVQRRVKSIRSLWFFYYIFHVKPHFLKTLFQSRLLFDFDDFLYARLLRRDVLWYTDCPSVQFLDQFTSNFAQILELMVLRSVYFLVKFRIFIPELWDFIHQIVGNFSCHAVNWEPLGQFTSNFA